MTWPILRNLIYLFMIVWLLSAACGCYYKPGSVYARVIKVTLTSEGLMHVVADNTGDRYVALYECLPDSVRPGAVVSVLGYKRLRTGGRLQVSILPGIGSGSKKVSIK